MLLVCKIVAVINSHLDLFQAAIIAFSSSFIPRIIYAMEHSQLGIEFAEFSLSSFNVSNSIYQNEIAPFPDISEDFRNLSVCR